MNTPTKNIILGIITAITFCLTQPTIGQSIQHQYDNLNRLIETKYGNDYIIQYCYDKLGNRTCQVVNLNTFQAVIDIQGNQPFCEGDAITLTASDGENYEWSTDETTQTITVNSSDTYTVTITNNTGQSAIATEVVTMNPLPNPPTTIPSDSPTFCEGESIELQAFQAMNLSWSTGETSSIITVNESGNYWATNTDANGCTSLPSDTIQVEVLPTPTASITPSGATEFCEGELVQLTATDGDSYFWYMSGLVFGVGSTVNITQEADYWVIVGLGSCLDTAYQSIEVYEPIVPTIDFDGTILTASSANSYQWFLNGVLIPGATNSIFTPTEDGIYRVETTDANGCHASSTILNVILNSVNNLDFLNYLNVFPNPTDSKFTLSIGSTEILKDIEIILLNNLGQSVLETIYAQPNQMEFTQTLSAENLPPGIYWLNLKINDKKITQKIEIL